MSRPRLAGALARLAGDCRGAIAVEAALASIFLAALVVGLLQLGAVMKQNSSLEAAARAGTAYALLNPTDTSGIQTAVEQASDLSATDMTVAYSEACECATTTVTCDTTCTGGVLNSMYLTVTVTQPAYELLPGVGLLDGVVLSGSATLRAR